MRILDQWAERSAVRLGAAQVFRPPVGVLVTVLWAVVTVVWLGAAALAGWRSLLVQLPVALLVAGLVYATCTRPLVAVGPDGVLLRNVLRDVRVPWPALEAVETKYALTLTAGGRRFAAWAAPAPSRFTTTRATPSDLRSLAWDPDDGPIPASATLRSDAGAAAALIRRFWTPPVPGTPSVGAAVDVRWDGRLVAVLVVAAALTVLVLTL